MILRTTRHVGKFKLMRVLCTGSHDTIHEARSVGFNRLTRAVQRRVDRIRIACAQETTGQNLRSLINKIRNLCARGSVRAARGAQHEVYFNAKNSSTVMVQRNIREMN
jgi:hypothetical protein